jgi:hypothetical protein
VWQEQWTACSEEVCSMATKVGKRGWLGAAVTVLVLGGIAVVAIYLSLDQSTNPDYQIRNERPGIGEYYANLWVDPQPPATGETEISTQLSTIIGTPIELSSLAIDVVPPDDGDVRELDTRHTYDGPNDGDLYIADTSFDQAGTWQVVLRYSFGGPEVEDSFDIEVAE